VVDVVDEVDEVVVLDEVLVEVLDEVVELPAVVEVPPLVEVAVEVLVDEPAVVSSSPPSMISTIGTATAAAIRMPIRKRAIGLRHHEDPLGATGAGGGGGGL
jgi:hypothetical protein